MIHFKLSLLSTTVNNNRLTNVKYSILPISEFYDQEYLYIHNKDSAAKKRFSTQIRDTFCKVRQLSELPFLSPAFSTI